MIGDNPAARLLAILEKGKEFKREDPCRSTWKKILGIEDQSDSLLMSRLGKVMELPEQIISIINKDFPNQKNTYSHWSAQVHAAFSQQNLNETWRTFFQNIDSHTFNYLTLNADLIQTKSPTSLISKEKLESLRENISELLTELIDSDLPLDFKKFFSRSLQKMICAIDEYRISGAIPVMDAVDGIFGHACIDMEYRKTLSESDFGKKAFTVLSVVADTISIAIGAPQLPSSIKASLEILKNSVG